MINPVKLTPKASEMVLSIMSKKGIPSDYSLRIGIKGGTGCLGVNYLLGFDKEKHGDQKFEMEGIPVLIEKKHTMFLLGLTIDYVISEGQQGFTFYKESAEIGD